MAGIDMDMILLNIAYGSNSFGLLYQFPMGLLNMAKAFEDRGMSCHIADIPYERKQRGDSFNVVDYVSALVREKQARMLGIYTRCDNLPTVVSFVQDLKAILPDLYIVLGGPGVTFVDEDIMRTFPEIDLVIRGEGEETVADVFCSEGLKSDYETAPGITYRKNGTVISNDDRVVIHDLDTLPLLDYKFIPQYAGSGTLVSVEAGRGCPCSCTFCSTSVFWSKQYRTKSPKHIEIECAEAMRFFGTTRLNLIHDNLIVSKKYIVELADHIRTNLPTLRWRCSGRVDMLDEEIIQSLISSGCESIFLGIETGNPEMQKTIGKNLNLEKAKETLALCDTYGLNCWVSFIIGFPGETEDQIEDTLSLALQCRQHKSVVLVQVHWLSPDPGSELYHEHVNALEFHSLLSDHVSSATQLTEQEINLVREHPSIFSSFYDLSSNSGVNRYKELLRCYKIFTDFYPRSMYELVFTYKLSHYEILSSFKCKCKLENSCDAFEDLYACCGYFEDIFSLFSSLGIDVQSPLREIAEYEKACVSLLLGDKAGREDGSLPRLSPNVRLIHRPNTEPHSAVVVRKEVDHTFISYSLNEETYTICALYSAGRNAEDIRAETGFDLEFIYEAVEYLFKKNILVR